MDSMIKIYLERAKNELTVAQILKKVTEEKEAKNYFEIEEGATFYSAVISHSYYAIFLPQKLFF